MNPQHNELRIRNATKTDRFIVVERGQNMPSRCIAPYVKLMVVEVNRDELPIGEPQSCGVRYADVASIPYTSAPLPANATTARSAYWKAREEFEVLARRCNAEYAAQQKKEAAKARRKAAVPVTLRNDFHNTTCTLLISGGTVTPSQRRRAIRELCPPHKTCVCAGYLGTRGPQDEGAQEFLDLMWEKDLIP